MSTYLIVAQVSKYSAEGFDLAVYPDDGMREFLRKRPDEYLIVSEIELDPNSFLRDLVPLVNKKCQQEIDAARAIFNKEMDCIRNLEAKFMLLGTDAVKAKEEKHNELDDLITDVDDPSPDFMQEIFKDAVNQAAAEAAMNQEEPDNGESRS